MEIKPLIGLEIHGYLTTKEKLFCSCPANYKDASPNSNICPICTAQPGAKPMLPNKEALKKVIAIALMLNCKINSRLIWQRKHYDWPDLPKGYQNTLSGPHIAPLGEQGLFSGIKIIETHLEEDPAKWDPKSGLIDYNRSGIPLIEIVTEPQFHSSEEVISWLNKLLLTLSYMKAVDPNAGIKADVNVNVLSKNKKSERVELKNLNSLDSIKKAVDYEIQRQTELLKEGKSGKKESRMFSEEKNKTVLMRSKEGIADYRFIPDPDLPLIEISESWIKKIKKELPESPEDKIARFKKRYNLNDYSVKVLTSNIDIADFFEKVINKIKNPALVSNWVTIELLRVLNYNKKSLHEVSINPEHFISLLKMIEEKKITELAAKRILNEFIPKSFDPSKKKGIAKIEDKSEIEKFCKEAIAKNPKAVGDYKKGEQKALNFLLGQVVLLSQRRADSKIAREILMKLLK